MGSATITRSELLVSGGEARRPRIRSWAVALLLGWLGQAVLRVVLGVQHAAPLLIPDESGYLLAARLLAGGSAADLSGRTFYQGGYPLLIAPAYWFSDDPQIVYHLAICVNASIGAGLLLLAYVALRRMGLPRGKAYLLAHATALLPSAVYYSQFALTDAVLPVLVLGWLLLLHTWLNGGARLHGYAAAAVAALAYSMHSRGIIILLVHVCLLAVVAVRRHRPRRPDVLVMAAITVVGVGLGWLLNAWIQRRIYPGGVAPLGDWLAHRLTSMDGMAWTLAVATGQVWHTLVATFGVAGIGLVVLAVIALRAGFPTPDRLLAGTILSSIAGVALATSAALPSEGTVANLAYGRYLACFTPVLFIVGLIVLTHCPRVVATRAVLATVGLTVATMAVVHLHAGERLTSDFFGVFDFPEISFLTGDWDSLSLGQATLTSMAAIIVAALLNGQVGRRTWPAVVATACILTELAIAGVVVAKVSAPWGRTLKYATDLSPVGLRPDDRVGMYYPGVHWRIWVSQAFQVPTELIPIDLHHTERLDPRVTLAVVPWPTGSEVGHTWPAAPPGWRPMIANQNHAGNWVAWGHISREVPDPPAPRSEAAPADTAAPIRAASTD
ncbi:hypothetical protein [Nonomuraea sp. B5E05]|uniref:hypothetical protein n=1 Tax=Nonomuraea sp. B5E05 TaxID=3153569 RepID=UPI0032601F38